GKNLAQIRRLIGRQFVVSRLFTTDGNYSIPKGDTILRNNDIILLVAADRDANDISELMGDELEFDWKESDEQMISRRIIITKGKINGKTLGGLKLRALN